MNNKKIQFLVKNYFNKYWNIVLLYTILTIFFVTVFNFINIKNFNADILNSVQTNCNWWTFNARYYEWENKSFTDNFYWDSNKVWAFWFNSSKVDIYNSNWILSSTPTFSKNSQIKPKWVNWVRFFTSNNPVTINKPTTNISRDNIAAQIVYNITRKHNNWTDYLIWTPGNYTYSTENWASFNIDYNDKPNFTSATYSDYECFNIYVSWCWDWTIDDWTNWTLSKWEECDNWILNWTAWNSCSATCKTIIPVTKTCWDWIIDTPNDSLVNEQCDDWNTDNWDWCSASCKLETPNCTISANPDSWEIIPLDIDFTFTKEDWANYKEIDFWDWNNSLIQNNTINHTYTETWTFNAVLTIENWYIWNIATWITKPENFCSTNILITNQKNWACWTAVKNYEITEMSYWTDTFCSEWNITWWINPNFPIEWWSESWTCDWENWWNISPICTATRTNAKICWDSNIDTPNDLWVNETCDDWNNIDWDWCSAICQTEIPVDWVCWTDNWQTLNSTPTNLCIFWTASIISGTWPWAWNCNWILWWNDVSCSANIIPKTCWDSNIDTPNDLWVNETCDDWNNIDWDWCSAICQTEIPVDWVCWISDWKTFSSVPTVNLCSPWTASVVTETLNPDWWTWNCNWVLWWATSWTCNATKSTIKEELHSSWWWSWERRRRALCWNWTVDFELEECDDWNDMAWDWCSRRCHIEKICWDWIVDAININWQREACDDWNNIDWDWCSSICEIDQIIRPKIINQQFCWNWKVEKWEECDDWNLDNFDSCNNVCLYKKTVLKPKKVNLQKTWPSEILYFLMSILLSTWLFFRKKIKKLFW